MVTALVIGGAAVLVCSCVFFLRLRRKGSGRG